MSHTGVSSAPPAAPQEALEEIQATVKEAESSRATIKRLTDKREDELSSYKTVAEELAAAKCLAQHFTKVWESLQEKLNKIGVEVDYVKVRQDPDARRNDLDPDNWLRTSTGGTIALNID